MKILLADYNAVLTIDDDDLPEFGKHRWYVSRKGNTHYVSRKDGPNTVFLHRQLLCAPMGIDVDHIDGNGLNNSRANLRLLSRSKNLWNSKRTKVGVCFSRGREKWRATIARDDGRRLELGHYATEGEARQARDVASVILRGEIGTLNGSAPETFRWDIFTPTARMYLREKLDLLAGTTTPPELIGE